MYYRVIETMIRQSRTNKCGNIRPLVHREYGCPLLEIKILKYPKSIIHTEFPYAVEQRYSMVSTYRWDNVIIIRD
mgnify:CR=1 FL=1